jgi:hypothetical protein
LFDFSFAGNVASVSKSSQILFLLTANQAKEKKEKKKKKKEKKLKDCFRLTLALFTASNNMDPWNPGSRQTKQDTKKKKKKTKEKKKKKKNVGDQPFVFSESRMNQREPPADPLEHAQFNIEKITQNIRSMKKLGEQLGGAFCVAL